jgi:hypothetical protein
MKSNQDRPEKFDKEIDAALKMLSETAPPAAMASRIHQSLEAEVFRSQQAKSRGRFWIPATCVAMTAVLFVVFSQARWVRQNRTSAVAPATLARVTPAPLGHTATRPAMVPAGNYSTRERFSQRADVRRSRREHPQYRHVANLLSYPLTRQEKLLIQFAKTAKPEDLQALNPEYQAKVEAQQEAEFVAYVHSGSDPSDDERTKTIQSTQE